MTFLLWGFNSPPPPVVIFATKLKIDHNNRDLTAGDDKDDKDEKQEAKHVVELILIDGGEDEEQLDEAGSKWQNSCHHRAHCWMHVPNLNSDYHRIFVNVSKKKANPGQGPVSIIYFD